jgi:hypothetical protein
MRASVSYESDTLLHWTTVDKDGKSAEGDELIDYARLHDSLHFLNWIEKDGWTVSQVIDTESGVVRAYWSFQDDASERGQRSSSFIIGTFEYAD